MFRSELARHGAFLPALTAEALELLERHFLLLMKWNRVVNLSSVRTEAEIVERHYCESLFLASHLPPGELSVADLGSGAGFPGIPVAAVRPDCRVSLIESHQRKAVFLREATRDMKSVEVIASRAEDIKRKFDVVVSRAVKLESRWLGGADAVYLLTGGEKVLIDGFVWGDAVRLPWGDNRFLTVGLNVSRETSSQGQDVPFHVKH